MFYFVRRLRHCKEEMGFYNVIVEMDSMLVISWLREGRCSLWYLEDFLEEIRSMLQKLNIQLQDVFREINYVVDFLAQLGGKRCNKVWSSA